MVTGQFDDDEILDYAFWIILDGDGQHVLVVSQSKKQSNKYLTEAPQGQFHYNRDAQLQTLILFKKNRGELIHDRQTDKSYHLAHDGVGVMYCEKSAHVWVLNELGTEFNVYWVSD